MRLELQRHAIGQAGERLLDEIVGEWAGVLASKPSQRVDDQAGAALDHGWDGEARGGEMGAESGGEQGVPIGERELPKCVLS